jgi:hypothetical protein
MKRNINSSRQASKRSRSSNASLESRIGAAGGRSAWIANFDMRPQTADQSGAGHDPLSLYECGANRLGRQAPARAIVARAAPR